MNFGKSVLIIADSLLLRKVLKRGPELRAFADEHDLAMISIEDLVRYRRRHELHVERVAETRLRALGVEIDRLTPEQERYIRSWQV